MGGGGELSHGKNRRAALFRAPGDPGRALPLRLWSVVTSSAAPVQLMTHSHTRPVRETLNSPTEAVYASFLEAAERFSGRRVIIFGKLLLAARGLGGRVRQEDPPPHRATVLVIFRRICSAL